MRIAALLALLLLASPALAQSPQSRATLAGNVNSAIVDNDQGLVTPAAVRTQLLNILASVPTFVDNPYTAGACTAGGTLPVASSNAELSAQSYASAACVDRIGFASSGDSHRLTYLHSTSPCPLNAGAGDGGSQVPINAPTVHSGCWLAQFAGMAWADDFGVFTANVDSVNAGRLNAWFGVAGPTLVNAIHTGSYSTNSSTGYPNQCNFCTFIGAGTGTTVINYTGTNQSVSILVFGSASQTSEAMTVSNFHVVSATTMNAGSGILLQNLNNSHVSSLYATGLMGVPGNPGGNGFTLWDGITFAGIHEIHASEFGSYAQHDCLALYGTSVLGFQNGDLWLTDHLEFGCTNGIHVGGNLGGMFISTGESLVNTNANVLQDDALDPSHRSNSVTFYGFHNDGDGVSKYGFYINETAGGASYVEIAGLGGTGSASGVDIDVAENTGGLVSVHPPFVSGILASFTGTIVGTALTTSAETGFPIGVNQWVYLNGASQGTIVSGSGHSWVLSGSPGNVGPVAMNSGNRGIYVEDASTTVAVASGTVMKANLVGIDASSQTSNITSQATNSGNVLDAGFNTGLSTFTAPTAMGGTSFAATTVVQTEQINQHLRHVEATVTVTAAGTGAAAITVPLPFAPETSSLIPCTVNAAGAAGSAQYVATVSALTIVNAAGAYPVTGAAVVSCGGDIRQ